MRKIFFIFIVLIASIQSFSQDVIGSRVIAKQSLFDQFLRMKLVKLPISQESSFKNRKEEVKQKHNYTFKIKEQDFLNGFPNIELLTFEPKN